MSNLITNAIVNSNPIVGGINAVGGLVKSIFGDKSAREDNEHSEQEAAFNELSSEAAAQQRDNRNWFDTLVDGLNRLPRPIIAFGVLAAMIWCPIDPVGFSATMQAYTLVPQWLALIFGQIILLFFGGRMLDKWNMNPTDPKVVSATIAHIKELRDMDGKVQTSQQQVQSVSPVVSGDPYKEASKISDTQYEKEMKDLSKPLSLDAIVAWNNKNHKEK